MRFSTLFEASLVLVTPLLFQPSTLLAQGKLTPPGAPAPVMKSLDQIEPRTPISSAPFTITNGGSYYLTANLIGASGAHGITIASGDVTLDLNGFALIGVPGSKDAVYAGTVTNITVRNGTVRGWGGNGVEVYDAYNEVLEHLTVSDVGGRYGIDAYGAVLRDCVLERSGTNASIYMENGVVRDCTVLDSPGVGIDAEAGSKVLDCVVNHGQSDGIDAYDSDVRNCVSRDNDYGIYVVSGTVSGCHVENSLTTGIYADGRGCQIVGNTCLGNQSSGIYIYDSNNRVENNHVTDSGGTGIELVSGYTNNIIVRNTVGSSGTNNYVTPGAQIVGPILTGAGTITNSSPWANFSF
jgi:parallel beta-helix repeat protein